MRRIALILGIAVLAQALPGGSLLRAEVDRDKLRKGLDAYRQEQWDAALNHFQDALLDDPENPQLQFNLGATLYKKEQYEEALTAFEKAQITQDIDLQESAYYNQGNTYYQLNKYQEAVESYKKALNLKPDDREAKHNLELVRAKLKEMADKQPQENQPRQEQVEPSEYAKQLKAQAEILVSQRLYKEAHDLMQKGLQTDPTVAAFQGFIDRIGEVVEIEETS